MSSTAPREKVCLLPNWWHVWWYSLGNGAPNTWPRSFSMDGALFCRPPNFPLLRIRSPWRVRSVGHCILFWTTYQIVTFIHVVPNIWRFFKTNTHSVSYPPTIAISRIQVINKYGVSKKRCKNWEESENINSFTIWLCLPW